MFIADDAKKYVSIPKRVSEALKRNANLNRLASIVRFQSLKGFQRL